MANPFEAARPFLWDGLSGAKRFETYICHAIGRAEKAKRITPYAARRAVAMVHNRLGGYKTLESWLCNEAYVSFADMRYEQVQAYRFLWLADLSVKWNQGERT